MTLEKLKFLIAASKKETEKQWGNRDGLQYTNELLDFLLFVEKREARIQFQGMICLVTHDIKQVSSKTKRKVKVKHA